MLLSKGFNSNNNQLVEIGGEFWVSDKNEQKQFIFPDWLKFKKHQKLTSLGRGAITLLLDGIEKRVRSKKALLPSYVCNSVLDPFLVKGYSCYFYHVNSKLEPVFDSLSEKVLAEVDVFLHLGYFGFPTNKNIAQIAPKIKKQGTFVVEDLSHTLFFEGERPAHNHFGFGSIRKWTGMPSGGFLSSDQPIVLNHNLPINNTYVPLREKALFKKSEYFKTNKTSLKEESLGLFRSAQKLMDSDFRTYQIDDLSMQIINNLDVASLKSKRRNNFSILLEGLVDIDLVEPVFKNLPDNVVPLFFPVYCHTDRATLRAFLNENQIYCPIHWPAPKSLTLNKYPVSDRIYNTILSIPCDQRYDEPDMLRIVESLKSYKKKSIN